VPLQGIQRYDHFRFKFDWFLHAAVYASDNQVSLPQFRRFELAVLSLESPAMKAQTSSIGHLIQSHLRRWKELTELSPQSTLKLQFAFASTLFFR
jgi:hypothetical protein